ncbi:Methylenetetrahydrofolate dehydrogenase [NAD(+)] [Thecaphora frezii]
MASESCPPWLALARCRCDRRLFSNDDLVAHLPSSVVATAAKPLFGSSSASRSLSTTPALSSSATPSSAASTPSLATPSLARSPSYYSASAADSDPQQQHSPKAAQDARPDSYLDLAHLNSLLFQLARPSQPSPPQTDAPAPFFSPAPADAAAASPSTPAPRLRGNGSLREPREIRAERKAKFESLLDTFHQATFCTNEPESSSYQLSASDLVSAFDQQGQPITPVSPNDVLRGIASSMSEPSVEPQAAAAGVQPLPSAENPGKLIQASGIAAPYQDAIKEAIQARVDAGKPRPKLVGILATPSPPSVAYAEWTRKACEAVGIEFEIWKTWDDAAVQTEGEGGEGSTAAEHKGTAPDFDLEADVEDLIIAANANDSVHGIMVYYPIFHGRQDTYLQQIVDPRKDVEGLHFSYCWNMYHNVRWVAPKQLGGAPGTTPEVPRSDGAAYPLVNGEQVPAGMAKSILPCTPLAMVKCLESIGVYDRALPYGDRLFGKTITVINRSEVVGRPLAALLSNDGAKVYSVDIDSIQEFNKRLDAGEDTTPGRARSKEVKEAHARNAASRLRPHHVVRSCPLTAQQCIEASDVVIAGVPSPDYKIPTAWIRPGAVCINFSSEKNFEKDVRTRAEKYLPAIGKTTIAMLQRNLLRLVEYRELASQ